MRLAFETSEFSTGEADTLLHVVMKVISKMLYTTLQSMGMCAALV